MVVIGCCGGGGWLVLVMENGDRSLGWTGDVVDEDPANARVEKPATHHTLSRDHPPPIPPQSSPRRSPSYLLPLLFLRCDQRDRCSNEGKAERRDHYHLFL